jgi:hypothetical protein
MSALPPKADIEWHSANVRFVPKADIVERRSPPVVTRATGGDRLTRPVPFHFGLTARVAGYLAPQLAGSVSAHVGCPLLPLKIIGTPRLRGQLKHRRLLSLS